MEHWAGAKPSFLTVRCKYEFIKKKSWWQISPSSFAEPHGLIAQYHLCFHSPQSDLGLHCETMYTGLLSHGVTVYFPAFTGTHLPTLEWWPDSVNSSLNRKPISRAAVCCYFLIGQWPPSWLQALPLFWPLANYF